MLFLVRISRRYGPSRARGGSWTLLTGHGQVLVEIARNTRARIGDIAAAAGLTERTVQAIIADLEAAGYLTRTRAGRRTVYTLPPRPPVPAARSGRTPYRPVPRVAGSPRRCGAYQAAARRR